MTTAKPRDNSENLRAAPPPEAQTGLGSQGQRIFVGTSGWAYASWKPGFYPPRTSAKKMLSFYGSQLNTVEVNYTFRQLPRPGMIEGWMAQVPQGFRFSFKAPQLVTHMRRLRECGNALTAFRAALAPALEAHRFGIALFQLPPNFKADAQRLHAFLSEDGVAGLRIAFEFRHPSWFTEEIFSLLEDAGAALCVAESDSLETPRRRTAPFTCYRLRRTDYTDVELEAVRASLLADAVHADVYAYFKHEERPDGALRARTVLAGVPGG